jgi:hypothetical protein
MRPSMSFDERLAHMLSKAEEIYGPRTHQRKILPVGFHADLPTACCPSPTTVEVRLPFDYKADYKGSCYMLAHECVHILSPCGNIQSVTVLEEGLATSFAHLYIRDHSAGDWTHSSESSANWCDERYERYDVARALVECFLAARPDAIRRLRSREQFISRISTKLISEIYPEIPLFVAGRLTAPFWSRVSPPPPLPQPIWLAPKKP